MKRAVVTGATGAIGTALVKELIAAGTEVLVLCREGSARIGNIPRHELVRIRYCSLDELRDIEPDGSYDVFYHFAWEGTPGNARNDLYLQERNIAHALDAVGAAKRFGCRRFIGVGSQAEYGRVEGLIKPDTPVFPTLGYGIAKLAAGQMTRQYAHQLGMEHIWVRVLSVYGPNDGAHCMVMSVINTLKSGGVPELTKGEQMWDYLFSGDAGKAFALLGDKGHDGKIYVLGSGSARPIAEYVRDIRDVAAPGAELALGAVPYSADQVMHLQADTSELERDTGWKAETPFREGIRITAESMGL